MGCISPATSGPQNKEKNIMLAGAKNDRCNLIANCQIPPPATPAWLPRGTPR